MTAARQPIKVLRVITRLGIGGPAQQVANLTAGLKSHGFETILVSGRVDHGGEDMAYYCETLGVPVRYIDTLTSSIKYKNDRQTFFELIKIIWKERPAILHTHLPKAGFLARMAARVLRPFGVRPVVFHTYHGHVFHSYFSEKESARYISLERRAAKWTHKLIAVTDMLRQELDFDHNIAEPDKFVVIGPGIDLNPFLDMPRRCGAFRKKIGVDDKTVLLGIVGRLDLIKDHIVFLDAFAAVLKEIPSAHAVVVGDGDERDRIRTHADKLGISDRVHWTGYIRDLREIYSDLDILAMTSKSEGAPISVIEAQAAGCPVIAADVGGTANVLAAKKDDHPKGYRPREEYAPAIHAKIREERPGGYLVKRMSGENFARACKDVLSGVFKPDPACRKLVAERYSAQRLCADTAKLYNEALKLSS